MGLSQFKTPEFLSETFRSNEKSKWVNKSSLLLVQRLQCLTYVTVMLISCLLPICPTETFFAVQMDACTECAQDRFKAFEIL